MAVGIEGALTGGASGEAARADRGDGSVRWFAMLLALAAGWGALFSYSAVFLSEDLPLRPGAAPARLDPSRSETAGFEVPNELARTSGALPTARRRAEASAAEEPVQPRPVAFVGLGPDIAPTPGSNLGAAQSASMTAERADYVGTWGPTGAACGARSRRRGYLPATITEDGARAGRTTCNFHDGRRSGNAWVMAADCSDRGRRWSSQVRLLVDGDRLTWTSGKGSSSYVRCSRRAG
ncbi:peptidase inhibitor family I36 protein [Methylobacterium nigriterrae]|uniref:peptidase inhibitor family I36 protein n=1 Tax=Methylobacterium nigriterrae TaxID=3127512 RepID=UPI003013C341